MKKHFLRAAATALTAVGVLAVATPHASAAVLLLPCRDDGIVRVCVTETAQTNVRRELYTVKQGTDVNIGSVAAYLDRYRLGTLTFTCVTPVTNGTEHDACGLFGFTRESRTPLVPHTEINVNVPQVGVLMTVYVCEATLVATAAGNGVDGETILTVCETGMPALPAFGT